MAINVAMILPIIIISALVIIGVIIFAYNKRLDKVVKGEVHDIHSNIPEPKTAISTTYQAVGVDISTDAALMDTIEIIGGYIDEIEKLTEELEG